MVYTYSKSKEVIHAFDYTDVVLKESMYKHQFEEMKKYYLSIPNDDILYGFRKRAGLPHPGRELGGWYNNDASFDIYHYEETFNTFGQWLSGFARIYSVTQDQDVLDKVMYLFSEWTKTIEDDGYFFYSKDCNALHYVYDKFVCGLVDLYAYIGCEDALNYLGKITNWAVKNLRRKKLRATAKVFNGWSDDFTDNEWYTLSENLYRAYLATGDKRYKEFAQQWHYNEYWQEMRQMITDNMIGCHGYSHVNTLCGAAMAYEVLGENGYLQTIINAYEIYKKHQLMASGGYAPDEALVFPEKLSINNKFTNGENVNIQGGGACGDTIHTGTIGKRIEESCRSFEVICGSWGGFKLSRYLLTLTGKAIYGEWIETLFYNAIGAALHIKDDLIRRGKTFYYADYKLSGGRKVYYECSFPCCSGTYPQVVTDYHNIIYFKDDKSLYINLFVPSTVKYDISGNKVITEQTTKYPEEDSSDLTFRCSEASISVKIRIPSWARQEEVIILVNGKKMDVNAIPGEWAFVERIWNDRDILTVKVPMHLRFVPIDSAHPNRAVLMYGPVMLAAIGKSTGALKADITNPSCWIKSEDDNPLHFKAIDNTGCDKLFIPFYEIGEKEWYCVYNDIEQ